MSISAQPPLVPATLQSPLLTHGPHKLLELVQYSCMADGVVAFHQLKIADRFTDTQPRWTAEALADKEGWDSGRLYRLLSAMRFVGLVAVQQPEDGFAVSDPERSVVWSLTDNGALLRSSHPCSKLGAWLEWIKAPYIAASQADMANAVATRGSSYVPGIQKYANSVGDTKQQWMTFLAQEPSQRHIHHAFSHAMSGLSEGEGPAIAATYHKQLSRTHMLIDIAGGVGTLSATLALCFPQLRAVNADLAPVIEQAKAVDEAQRQGVSGRCQHIAIDFFRPEQLNAPIAAAAASAVSERGEVVISVKHILHDWSHEQCIAILSNLRSAVLAVPGLAPLVRLAVMEMTYLAHSHPTAVATNWVTAHMDLFMMGIGGAQRSEAQWTAVLKEAGWTVTELYAGNSPMQVLEAVLAD